MHGYSGRIPYLHKLLLIEDISLTNTILQSSDTNRLLYHNRINKISFFSLPPSSFYQECCWKYTSTAMEHPPHWSFQHTLCGERIEIVVNIHWFQFLLYNHSATILGFASRMFEMLLSISLILNQNQRSQARLLWKLGATHHTFRTILDYSLLLCRSKN